MVATTPTMANGVGKSPEVIMTKTCKHCGHTGDDVIERTVKVAGVWVQIPECYNQEKCWQKWDKKQ